MGTVLARIGLVSLVVGVALPWAHDSATGPPLGFTHVSMSLWPAFVATLGLVAAVFAVRLPWLPRAVPATVAGAAALVFAVLTVPIIADRYDLEAVVATFPPHSGSVVTAAKATIVLAIAGLVLLALAPLLRPAPEALLGKGLGWAEWDAGRKLAKRLLAAAAVVLAVVNLIALLFRVGPDRDQWAIATTSDAANVVPSSAFMIVAVLFVAVMIEDAITVESGKHQRWLNPVRALVLIVYAIGQGGGSGFLYWVDSGTVGSVAWLTPAPAVLAAIACVIAPRGRRP
jgi:hypothetical protein